MRAAQCSLITVQLSLFLHALDNQRLGDAMGTDNIYTYNALGGAPAPTQRPPFSGVIHHAASQANQSVNQSISPTVGQPISQIHKNPPERHPAISLPNVIGRVKGDGGRSLKPKHRSSNMRNVS